jgi:signal transduction histidine kinase
LEHNGLPVKFDQFNLGDLVRDCGSQFAILASSKSVTVRVTVPDQAIIIDGDRLYLRRVLDNLMDNALKFSPQGGVIDLRLVADDAGNAVVTVADTGAGITEDAMKTLFTKFWQGPTGRNYASSIGIGLYLAKIIVEAHNGKISCTSEIGGGATFEVRVPALPVMPVVQASLSSASGGVDGGSVV